MNPGKKAIRKAGYVQDQKGILKRYSREKTNWDSHLDNCKTFIKKALENTSYKSLAVLGSGWLLDIPVDFLLNTFEIIYLVDIHHPREVKHKYAFTDKIKWVEDDLTGNGIELLHKKHKGWLGQNTPRFDPSQMEKYRFPFPPPDLVISLNLLNQLDILFIDYLLKKKTYGKETIIDFRTKIQQNHIDFITDYPFLLISDVTEQRYNPTTNQEVEREPLIYTALPECAKQEAWEWKFDTHQRYHKQYNITFEVIAYNCLK